MENNLVEDAKAFSAEAHKNQTYGRNLPYIVHLSDVYIILYEFGVRDENLLIAGWLHDIIEDTNITFSKIKNKFGLKVAEIVYAVTDELGRNRREKHEKTYPKLQQNSKAIVVKQADRLANIKTGIREGNTLLDMYKKEYSEFKEKLQPFGGLDSLWKELDKFLVDENE